MMRLETQLEACDNGLEKGWGVKSAAGASEAGQCAAKGRVVSAVDLRPSES